MANRIEQALAAWNKRQGSYESLYGPAVLESRAFSKVRLSEMRRLYQEHRPPRNRDERVSLALLRAANRSQERRLYPNRILRYGRKLVTGVARLGGRLIRGIAAMMQENPAQHMNPPPRERPEKAETKAVKPKPVQRPNVVRMQVRRRYHPQEGVSRSKGMRR